MPTKYLPTAGKIQDFLMCSFSNSIDLNYTQKLSTTKNDYVYMQIQKRIPTKITTDMFINHLRK